MQIDTEDHPLVAPHAFSSAELAWLEDYAEKPLTAETMVGVTRLLSSMACRAAQLLNILQLGQGALELEVGYARGWDNDRLLNELAILERATERATNPETRLQGLSLIRACRGQLQRQGHNFEAAALAGDS